MKYDKFRKPPPPSPLKDCGFAFPPPTPHSPPSALIGFKLLRHPGPKPQNNSELSITHWGCMYINV